MHYSSVFNLPVSQIDTVGLIHGYVPVWIFPVVGMYPLGAASSDSQRLLVGGLLLLNALFVSNQFDALHDQFLWMGICFLGSLLGYPLAVIGNHS